MVFFFTILIFLEKGCDWFLKFGSFYVCGLEFWILGWRKGENLEGCLHVSCVCVCVCVFGALDLLLKINFIT